MNFIVKDFESLLSHFKLEGEIKGITPLGSGLINDTYCVETVSPDTPNYVLQRINHAVFQDVELLQNNIWLVTNHIKKKLKEEGVQDITRRVLTLIKTTDDKTFWFDGESYWRVTILISDATTLQAVNPESSYYAGSAFGQFEYQLADLEEPLGDTIPNFHNMEFRIEEFKEALKNNKANRVDEVQDIIDEIEKRAEEMCMAERLHREGKLPKRICHGDSKVNNILFDEEGNVLCVIDLDTTMPNFIFSDYGDFLRTGANTTQEDDPDLNQVSFNMDIFKSFTKGYLESAKAFLTPIEIENLPFAVKLFPYMQCVRFLTDYINGDTYYKIEYPTHNLVRTKNQLRLLECIEDSYEAIQDYINQQL